MINLEASVLALQDQAMECVWSRRHEIDAIIEDQRGRVESLTRSELLFLQCAMTLMGYLHLSKATNLDEVEQC